jgi:hypothetical protein
MTASVCDVSEDIFSSALFNLRTFFFFFLVGSSTPPRV